MLISNSIIDPDSVVAYPIYDKHGELDRGFKSGDYFKHFKNHICRFVGWATHTETEEELAVYECFADGHRGMFVRPKEMFLSRVDRGKYPDVEQEYRMMKVFLEKKTTNHSIMSMTMVPEADMGVLMAVREFLHSYHPEHGEKIQIWVTGEISTSILKMQRPTKGATFLRNLNGEASLHHTIQFGRVIQFQTDSVKETIKPGDSIHFVGENRMVIENADEHVYEFFEVIPGVKDLY